VAKTVQPIRPASDGETQSSAVIAAPSKRTFVLFFGGMLDMACTPLW
jgi:hypothetical protein